MIKSLKTGALVCVLFLASSVALAGDSNGPPAPEQSSTSVTTSIVTTLILLVVR
jgi:hypothetical protein